MVTLDLRHVASLAVRDPFHLVNLPHFDRHSSSTALAAAPNSCA